MEVTIDFSERINDLNRETRSLIQRAFATYHPVYGFSTTSCQIYDTAWVSMISKTIDGKENWLFPGSFQYLLHSQAEDGGWGKHPKSKTAGVLDTAAALLALIRHSKKPLQLQDLSPLDIKRRIYRAAESLQTQLATWDDILITNHIGVELIVPALLSYLEHEDYNLSFDFASKPMLMSMHEAKMARFKPETLYEARPSSALHSLEAFISSVDFDKIKHHLSNGSMLASPSSTAAYLMHASSWDEEAEAYLQHVAATGAGHGDGGIPGTFPTTYFEFNWTLATLLRAGFSRPDIECDELCNVAKVIIEGFQADKGVIGFAPHAIDVDDTAKGLLALSLLGHSAAVDPKPMISIFESKDHFSTFGGERDPSFTSNCHVLLALLQCPDREKYMAQIIKTVNFLSKTWWESDGLIKDKWHLSNHYPMMLLAQAFTDLIGHIENGALPGEFDLDLLSKVSICAYQACLRTLLSQEQNGSWNGQPEETSYAVLTLAEAGRLVFFKGSQSQIAHAISQGNNFLCRNDWKLPDRSWTSKTAYRAAFVAEAYRLASLRAGLHPLSLATIGHSIAQPLRTRHTDKCLKIICQTKLFAPMAEWEVRATFMESMLFIPLLRVQRSSIYDRDLMQVSDDNYLDMIPFTWVGCSNRLRTFVASALLLEMMIISMLGYQTDEFIETIVAPTYSRKIADLHSLVDKLIDAEIAGQLSTSSDDRNTALGFVNSNNRNANEKVDRTDEAATNGLDANLTPLKAEGKVRLYLQRFIHHVLAHREVLKASAEDQTTLRHELRAFLHAHAVQVEDNALAFCSAPQPDKEYMPGAGRPFLDWVRTTAADHVACAYSFAFACCLISASITSGYSVFTTVEENYLARAAMRHMATMCRLCNDFGSVDRDLAEGNINSINFPEFAAIPSLIDRKQSLYELAMYERSCMIHAIDRLEEAFQSTKTSTLASSINQKKVGIIRFFADVTDFYDQLYIVRDLSSSVQQRSD